MRFDMYRPSTYDRTSRVMLVAVGTLGVLGLVNRVSDPEGGTHFYFTGRNEGGNELFGVTISSGLNGPLFPTSLSYGHLLLRLPLSDFDVEGAVVFGELGIDASSVMQLGGERSVNVWATARGHEYHGAAKFGGGGVER